MLSKLLGITCICLSLVSVPASARHHGRAGSSIRRSLDNLERRLEDLEQRLESQSEDSEFAQVFQEEEAEVDSAEASDPVFQFPVAEGYCEKKYTTHPECWQDKYCQNQVEPNLPVCRNLTPYEVCSKVTLGVDLNKPAEHDRQACLAFPFCEFSAGSDGSDRRCSLVVQKPEISNFKVPASIKVGATSLKVDFDAAFNATFPLDNPAETFEVRWRTLSDRHLNGLFETIQLDTIADKNIRRHVSGSFPLYLSKDILVDRPTFTPPFHKKVSQRVVDKNSRLPAGRYVAELYRGSRDVPIISAPFTVTN